MNPDLGTISRERVLEAGIGIAQAHGYGGSKVRDVARVEGMLVAATTIASGEVAGSAQAIFPAVAGAQRVARRRSDITLFDGRIQAYRSAGLLPAAVAMDPNRTTRRCHRRPTYRR